MFGRVRQRWGLAVVTGAVLALSSSARLGNALGRDDKPLGSLQVWLLLALAALIYTALVGATWNMLTRITDRRGTLVLIAVVGAAVAVFLVIYPRYGQPANASGYGDADDALNVLVDEITDGLRNDPYEQLTYLGNRLSPMIGGAVAALPFRVVLGSAAYQNPFWLVAAVIVLHRRWGGRVALGITFPVLMSLGFAEDYLLGGDYFASGIALGLGVYGFLAAVEHGHWWPWIAALPLGILSANRTTTLPVLALVAAVLFACRRLRASSGPLALALVVNLALWTPWWLGRADDFPPIAHVAKLGPPVARWLAFAIVLTSLGWVATGRWRRPDTGTPSERLAREGGILATGAAPAVVWSPIQLFRVVTYLWLVVPALGNALQDRFPSTDQRFLEREQPVPSG